MPTDNLHKKAPPPTMEEVIEVWRQKTLAHSLCSPNKTIMGTNETSHQVSLLSCEKIN
jgi:hypothetical protein